MKDYKQLCDIDSKLSNKLNHHIKNFKIKDSKIKFMIIKKNKHFLKII